jgi:hypothetical protein
MIAGLTALLVICGTLLTEESQGGRRRRGYCNPCYNNSCCAPQATCCAPGNPCPSPSACDWEKSGCAYICLQMTMFNYGEGTCSYSANCFDGSCDFPPTLCEWDGECGQVTPQSCPCGIPKARDSKAPHGSGIFHGRPGLNNKVNTDNLTEAQVVAWENQQKWADPNVVIDGRGWFKFNATRNVAGNTSTHVVRTRFLQMRWKDPISGTRPFLMAYEVTNWSTDSGLTDATAPPGTPDATADPRDGVRKVTYNGQPFNVRICFSQQNCP